MTAGKTANILPKPTTRKKQQPMTLRYLSIGRKEIKFGYTLNPQPDNENVAREEHDIVAHEAPLPELTNAYSKLAAVLCEINEWPAEYAAGLIVHRITVSTTKHGTRSVKLFAKKQLEKRRDYLHPFTSPYCQIDEPADGESGQIDIDNTAHLEIVLEALEQAERYANGERSQQLLGFDDGVTGINALAEKGRNADGGDFLDFEVEAKKTRKAN